MNIRQLIELLEQYPDDMPVVVQSYEAGYDPVTDVRQLTVAEVEDKAWYVGVYADAEKAGQQALLIASKFRNTD